MSTVIEGEQNEDDVSVNFFKSLIIPYNGAIRKEGGSPERDGEEEGEKKKDYSWSILGG